MEQGFPSCFKGMQSSKNLFTANPKSSLATAKRVNLLFYFSSTY